ncbi:MAG: DUF72 domain-containing protein [Cytophagales bacterium]|nr:MAG: DUF72 domain-containing protein [Cytophagales bacterium]TAF61227.1 MAG: DUF72 domain-containing protein [Cytophagales bacterium]
MEFGRVLNPDNILHQLPPDHMLTGQVLQQYVPLNAIDIQNNIFVGCPVWTHQAWKGRIFPPQTPQKEFLKQYALQFNTIELNATHYKIPTREQILKWAEQTPPHFLFCPKIPQSISHYKQLNGVDELNEFFCNAVAHFEQKLGLSFLQLSDRFSPSRLDLIHQYVDKFPKGIPLAVELRHKDWFEETQIVKDFFDFMVQKNVSTIITDTSGCRYALGMRLTTPVAAIRFLANDRHSSDFQRLDDWTERLKTWFEQGLQRLYFWVHDYENTYAPDLADYFIQKLNLLLGISLKRPFFYSQQSLF